MACPEAAPRRAGLLHLADVIRLPQTDRRLAWCRVSPSEPMARNRSANREAHCREADERFDGIAGRWRDPQLNITERRAPQVGAAGPFVTCGC